MPAVVLRNRHKFSPRTRTIHSYALCVWAKMAAPGQTIATMSTRDVALADYKIALCKSFHVIADVIDDADKLVTDCHRHRNRFLRPRVPVVDVYVSSTDRRFQNADEHVVAANFWNRNFLKPETGLGFSLHNGLHHFLHNGKLGQSGKQEKSFASGTGSKRQGICPLVLRFFRGPRSRGVDAAIRVIARASASFRPQKSLSFPLDTPSAFLAKRPLGGFFPRVRENQNIQ